MISDTEHTNRALRLQVLNLTNENTSLRGRLDGCVSADKYNAVLAELEAVRTENAVLRSENNEFRDESVRLNKEVAIKDARIKELEEANGKLESEKKEAADLLNVLKRENLDKKSVIELLKAAHFGRSSEQSAFINGLMEEDNVDVSTYQGMLACVAALTKEAEISDGQPLDSGTEQKKSSATGKAKRKKKQRPSRKGCKLNGVQAKVEGDPLPPDLSEFLKNVKVTLCRSKKDSWIVRLLYFTRPRAFIREFMIARCYVAGEGILNSKYPKDMIIDGCSLTPGFVRLYLTLKVQYNLSEQNILKMLESMKCRVPQSTLNRWMQRVEAFILKSLMDAMLEEIHSSPFTHNDETRIVVRSVDENGEAHYHVEYIHSALAPSRKLFLMVYHEGSRDHTVIEDTIFRRLEDLAITADRCSIYPIIQKKSKTYYLIRGACWAHARRYILHAFVSDSRLLPILKCIQALFLIERYCREHGIVSEARLKFRQKHSEPIVNQIMDALAAIRAAGTEYGELVQRAVNYILEDEDAFRAFLRNGLIELDNNAIERLFRHLAMGRRNWMHTGSHNAASNLSFMYSLYESCLLNGIDFGLYIETILQRLISGDTDYRSMLPNHIVLPEVSDEEVDETMAMPA